MLTQRIKRIARSPNFPGNGFGPRLPFRHRIEVDISRLFQPVVNVDEFQSLISRLDPDRPVNSIISKGRVIRGYLGVGIQVTAAPAASRRQAIGELDMQGVNVRFGIDGYSRRQA